MTRQNLMPWLGRGFIGDGVATTVAGLGGGTGVTTYAENIGVMAVTKVYSTAIFVIAGFTAILLGLCPKFGAVIATIPSGVLGGIATVLFGLIAATGFRIWTENQVDFADSGNLFIVAVTIIVGTADYTVHFGDFAMGGIALATFGIIILNQLFGSSAVRPPRQPAGPASQSRMDDRLPTQRGSTQLDDRARAPQRAPGRAPSQRPVQQDRPVQQRPAATSGYDRAPQSAPPRRRPVDDRYRRGELDDLPDFPDDEPRPRTRR
jgi:hypothetical protein